MENYSFSENIYLNIHVTEDFARIEYCTGSQSSQSKN